MTPTAGQVAVCKLSLVGAAADTIVPGINWDLMVDGKVVDKSNFRDGRYKVGTLADATLKMTLVWDGAVQPTDPLVTGIRTGVRGTAKCYVDSTHFFSLPVVVSTIGVKNEGVEDVLMADVEYGLSGDITYPVALV